MPNELTRITAGITPTAPNGGVAANANDDDETTVVTGTTDVGTVDPYVVIHYDLGSAKAVLFADVVNLFSTGGSSTQFRIQHSTDNVAFTDLGTAFAAVDTTARGYRRVGPITARYWRVAKVGGTDMGAVDMRLGEFSLWQDAGTISDGRTVRWEVSTDERYVAIFTDRSITIYNAVTNAIIDRCPSPYEDADLADLDADTNAETMVLTHEDYPTRFLVRESVTNFQCFPVEFDEVPQADFADTSSPAATSDVQTITFGASWIEGDTFQISLEGARTGPIVYAGDVATTAENIARAVQELWTVPAFTGVSCVRTGALVFAVTLADASAKAYDRLTVTWLGGQSTERSATVVHTTTGVSRHEPLWSAARGYPRTVAFFEGRLYFGGTRSRQQSLIGSKVNNILALEVGEGLDDDAVFVTLNGAQLNAIQGLFAGAAFQQFTSGGEFRYVKEQGQPVLPGDTPKNQTQYGAAKIRPASLDGATLFVQRNRNSIRDFRFAYEINAYDSLGVSSLASHLLYDVRDMAAWNGSTVDEIGLVLVVNATNPLRTGAVGEAVATYTDEASGELIYRNGTTAIFNSRKEANVQAWTNWETQGEFKAVATILEDIYFLVKRSINGVNTLFFEQADDDYYTDCAVQITNSPASTSVTGLSHLNGEVCRVRADGFVLANVTPVAGAATIERASTNVEVGLDWDVQITPMPLQTISPTGTNLMRKKRVVKVRAKVRKTLGLKANGRPLPDRFWDQDNFDEAATPFTGMHELEESTNWDQKEDKIVRFTQTDPLPLELLGFDVQLEGE